MNKCPTISVVIPSLGRERALRATLLDLSRQTHPGWECIVVLQGDLESDLVQELYGILPDHLRVFYADEPNASLARNIGIFEAKNDVVLFLDDDVEIANPAFLSLHALHYKDPSIVGVAGQILGPDATPRETRHWLTKLVRTGWLFFPLNYRYSARIAAGGSGNLSVRRSSAVAVGGMDAQYEKGAHREESDFTLRLAEHFGLLIFDPQASLVHLGEPVGGCRSWSDGNMGITPLHHACGEWYFILKGLKLRTIKWFDLPFHLYALWRRQVATAANVASFARILEASRRSLEGMRLARRKLKEGPRHLDSLSWAIYREISTATDAKM